MNMTKMGQRKVLLLRVSKIKNGPADLPADTFKQRKAASIKQPVVEQKQTLPPPPTTLKRADSFMSLDETMKDHIMKVHLMVTLGLGVAALGAKIHMDWVRYISLPLSLDGSALKF